MTPDKAPRRYPVMIVFDDIRLPCGNTPYTHEVVEAKFYDAIEAELQRERRKVALLYTELNYYIMDCGRKQAEQKEIDEQLEAIDKGDE